MKYLFFTILIAFLLGCQVKDPASYDLVITNVNLIDGTGKPIQPLVSIGIRDGKILRISNDLAGNVVNSIDGTGKYLIPGLFDSHVHTSNFKRDFPRLIHYGVTSIFITGGSLCTNDYYAAMRAQGDQDTIAAPLVFHTSQHFSMEGRHPSKTYPSSNWRDEETIFFLKDTLQIEKIVQKVAQHPIVGIKLTIEDGPAPPFVERIPKKFIIKTVKEASKYGLEVFAHVSDNTELEMAIQAGVQNLVHFTGVNINPQDDHQLELLSHFKMRNPSWVTTLMIDKSFLYPLHPEWFEEAHMIAPYRSLANDLTPELTKRATFYANLLMEEYGLDDHSLPTLIRPQVEDILFLYKEGFNMVLGTDTGNDFNFPGYSLHEEMQLLELGGMAPLDIIKMGTFNAAKMIGALDSLGSIEVGKIANMILLDKNPLESISNTLEINTVIKKGKIQKRIEK